MTTDAEFRAAAKLNAHDKVMELGGPVRISMGEMINVGVDSGIDFERLRVVSILRRRAALATEPTGVIRELLMALAAQVEDGIQ